ncbi:hypothetical protein ABT095_38360 [Kitasatospora sp. NPDC002227]|uniref:hypothetical protein n=1 Tax=Kitasatospora sp. NPDC002227 TaxID=3154773 RepID=UPI00332EDF10
MSLHDLRYSQAALALAVREGRRPLPRHSRHQVTSWHWLQLVGRKGSFHSEIAMTESRFRLRCRLDAQRLRGLHRAGHDLDGADIPPARHRRGALWRA